MRRLFSILLLLSIAIVSPLLLHAQGVKVLPVDESWKDTSLVSFQKNLLKAAKDQDTVFVYSVVDTMIKNGFGDDPGIEIFKRHWRSPKPDFRKELITAIKLGGVFYRDNKQFFVPYLMMRFPQDYDAFEYSVVIGDHVNVRQEPNLSSNIITELSYDIVKVKNHTSRFDALSGLKWIEIELPQNKVGYICKDYVRSPIDYRFSFEKKGSRWLLTGWFAGD